MLDFAGGNGISTILSHISGALLPMFTTKDACSLRLVCKEFKKSISEYQWDDQTNVKGSIQLWKICFPRAKSINIRDSNITDLDFIHLENVKKINMSYCKLVTDNAFKYLQDTHTLNMEGCDQITNNAFSNLKKIHTLNILGCFDITDDVFINFTNINTLDISYCFQVTNKAIKYLTKIHILNIICCDLITDNLDRIPIVIRE